MPDQPLFRARALESIDSLDGLDEMMTIVPARAWIALAAICALCVAILIWGLVGRVPVVERGAGIVSATGGPRSIIAVTDGFLFGQTVPIGSTVRRGQVLARIRTPELETVPLLADIDGTVVDVRRSNNAALKTGDVVLSIDPENAKLSIDGFVEYRADQSVVVGSAAQLKALDASAAASSPVQGIVAAAAPAPATAERIASILGNDRIAQTLSGTSVREVTIDVHDGRANFPAGAPFSIAVVTDEISPLAYLFPHGR